MAGSDRLLLDQFIRPRQHRGWDRQAERLCGLEIYEQLDPSRTLYREISRFRAPEDLVDQCGSTSEVCRDVHSIPQQPSGLDERFRLVYPGKPILCRQLNDPASELVEDEVRHDH